MDKFMLLSMKRTGSNNLMNSIRMSSREKLVWFDAPPKTWETFNLPFSKNIWEQDIKWCLDELYKRYNGCKINIDEPGFYNIVDELLKYDVKIILLFRENIWEKVISEELAIQSNHWVAPIGAYRNLKTTHKYESIDVESVKNSMSNIKSKMNYLKTFIGGNIISFKYEDLFSRNNYNQSHRDNFFKLLSELNIKYEENKIDDIISQNIDPNNCYKTDDTYQNIANIFELEKLKNYL